MINGYIFSGAWTQRTKIHVLEFYDMLLGRKPNIAISSYEAKKISANICDSKVNYEEEDESTYLKFSKKEYNFKYIDDGTVFCWKSIEKTGKEEIKKAVEETTKSFENSIIESFKKVYSAGAPTPRIYFQVTKRAVVIFLRNPKQVKEIFDSMEDEIILKKTVSGIDAYFGRNTYVFVDRNLKAEKIPLYEEIAEASFFIIDFEKVLKIVLEDHRIVWNEIEKIKRKSEVVVGDLPFVRDQLMDLLEDISYIETRLEQMEDYLEKKKDENVIIKNPVFKRKVEKMGVIYRYHTKLWKMTKEFNDSAIELLNLVYSENEQAEMNFLQIIFLIGTIAGLCSLGLLSDDTFRLFDAAGNLIATGEYYDFNAVELIGLVFLIAIITLILFSIIRYVFEKTKKFKRIKFSRLIKGPKST